MAVAPALFAQQVTAPKPEATEVWEPAYELSKNAVSSVLLEKDSSIGGLSRTVEYKGNRFDIGGHRFYTKIPMVEEIWHEVLGKELLIRPRLSRIYYKAKFFHYPSIRSTRFAGSASWKAFDVA